MKIGVVITGSFCTFEPVFRALQQVKSEGYELIPIMSENAYHTDTRFGKAKDWRERIELLSGNPIIHSIPDAEPIGPKGLTDLMVVAQCTGNTLAKLANGITDTTATMAVKSHLRNGKPLLIALATNDALSASAKNIGILLNKKHVFFLPFAQDDPLGKPTSLVADFSLLPKALAMLKEEKQMEPLLLQKESSK